MSKRNPRNLLLLQQIARNPFAKTVAPRAFDILSDFERDMEAVGLDRRLSAEGRQDKARGLMRSALRDLRDIQKPLDEFRAKTETMRAAVKGPAYDKTDIVAAMARRELRDASRAMTPGQRAMYMTGKTRSTDFIDAVLEQPAWLSGFDLSSEETLDAKTFETAQAERSRDLHGSAMDTIAERDADVKEIVDSVINVVRNDLRADYAADDFDVIAKAIESKANAPWLQRWTEGGREVIRVVDLENHLARIATEDEVRDGQFFENLQAYQAARAA